MVDLILGKLTEGEHKVHTVWASSSKYSIELQELPGGTQYCCLRVLSLKSYFCLLSQLLENYSLKFVLLYAGSTTIVLRHMLCKWAYGKMMYLIWIVILPVLSKDWEMYVHLTQSFCWKTWVYLSLGLYLYHHLSMSKYSGYVCVSLLVWYWGHGFVLHLTLIQLRQFPHCYWILWPCLLDTPPVSKTFSILLCSQDAYSIYHKLVDTENLEPESIIPA